MYCMVPRLQKSNLFFRLTFILHEKGVRRKERLLLIILKKSHVLYGTMSDSYKILRYVFFDSKRSVLDPLINSNLG